MEVYQSSKTAAEMEYALGAIPSIGANNHWFIGDVDTGVLAEGLTPYIGANGNWWVGETDSGIFAGGVKIEGAAEVGQTIVVKAVDENGKPTEWECAELQKPDEYVTVFHKKFDANVAAADEWGGEYYQSGINHYWCADADGNDLNADAFYVRISVPEQTENIVNCGEIKVFVGKGKAYSWTSYGDGEQGQPYIGYASFVPSSGQSVWAGWDYDLRTRTLQSNRKQNAKYNGSFQGTGVQVATSFEQSVVKNNWVCWNGIQIRLASGSLPAGTEILIYARKCDPAKIPNLPSWGV